MSCIKRRFAVCSHFLMIIALTIPTVMNQLQAAERAQVMLVLDASGSMWGRIDDKEKILIAREVVAEILTDWDDNTDLGVIAYGHRRKGDCSDIETLVTPGPADVGAIAATINNITPKGKTPLSDAVIKAADALRFTEERATVILVSDGIETCDRDPCAVGAELERSGVDFTAHVIGFDVAEEERGQLQCLAEATGGQYFDADKAEELQSALTVAVEQVAQVQAQPEPVEVTPEPAVTLAAASLQAADQAPAGSQIEVSWEGPDNDRDYITVVTPDTPDNHHADYAYTRQGSPLSLLLSDQPGLYEIRYVDNASKTVLARRPIMAAEITASITAPDAVPLGQTITIEWQGPDNQGDYITVVNPDAPPAKHGAYAYTRSGSPVQLRMPDLPGVYELRYISSQSKIVLAQRPIEVQDVQTSVSTAPSAEAGKIIEVEWKGPDNQGDYITVVTPDTPDNQYGKYAYTRQGSPAKLQMPDQAGAYEIRYISAQSKKVLARSVIELNAISASISAPEVAAAGETIQFEWQGPNNQGDYLTIVTPDTPENKHGKYAYSGQGSPSQLQVPDQPGVYEIRYISAQSKTALARHIIQINAVSASINALNLVATDSNARIEWQGPANKGDYITVVTPDTPDNKHGSYNYVNNGSPTPLAMPKEPGTYEIRYVMGQSKTVLARRIISVIGEGELAGQIATEPAATVTLQALSENSAEPVDKDLSWTLYSIQGGDNNLQRSSEGQPQFSLPMGIYRASASLNGATQSLDFIVNPGENLIKTLILRN